MNAIDGIEIPPVVKANTPFVLKIRYSLQRGRSVSLDVGVSADAFDISPPSVALERAPAGASREVECTITRKSQLNTGPSHCFVRVSLGDSVREKQTEVE